MRNKEPIPEEFPGRECEHFYEGEKYMGVTRLFYCDLGNDPNKCKCSDFKQKREVQK